MDKDVVDGIAQIADWAREGVYGVSAREAASSQETGVKALASYVNAICCTEKDIPEVEQVVSILTQVFIVVYRDSNRIDEAVGNSFVRIFLEDYPGTTSTRMFECWKGLMESYFNFKKATQSGDLLQNWQSAKDAFSSYNEFIGRLSGILLVCWGLVKGKRYSAKVLNNAYGSKLNELRALTDGENGPFYLLFRLAKPEIRNAIAHGAIELDSVNNVVKYREKDGTISRITVTEFLALIMMGGSLAQCYLAAISAIVVVDSGDMLQISRLPMKLRQLLAKSDS